MSKYSAMEWSICFVIALVILFFLLVGIVTIKLAPFVAGLSIALIVLTGGIWLIRNG